MDYISRDELRKHLADCMTAEFFDSDMKKAVVGIDVYVENMPAADVQPISHGRWDFQGDQLFKCTNCTKIYTQEQLEDIGENWTFPNFCPNCGAKMSNE